MASDAQGAEHYCVKRDRASTEGTGDVASGGHPQRFAMPAGKRRRLQVVLIEGRGFLRECLARSLGNHLPGEIAAFASVKDWLTPSPRCEASLVILSIGTERVGQDRARRELSTLFSAIPDVPVIVLSDQDDLSAAIDAVGGGAKGYLSTNTAFPVAMGAVHFVQAGGTYLPAEYLHAVRNSSANTAAAASGEGLTSREFAVVQAIRKGKSNKLIAYDLNMCESTVKVHVRHIMKKLHARNRTEVAIKAASLSPSAQLPALPRERGPIHQQYDALVPSSIAVL